MGKHWLVIYDICDPRRLRRVAKVMEDYGFRVQKSVFELEASEAVVAGLRRRINKIIEENDFVVYFDLCQRCWQKRMKYGPGDFCERDEKEFYLL
jgi:CRISPR-associated protein Cas2